MVELGGRDGSRHGYWRWWEERIEVGERHRVERGEIERDGVRWREESKRRREEG